MIAPMLCHDLSPDDPWLQELLDDDDWIAEQKYDGNRVLVEISEEEGAWWYSRSGRLFDWKRHEGWRSVHLHCEMIAQSMSPGSRLVFDAEALATGQIVVFDLIEANLLVRSEHPLSLRVKMAETVIVSLGEWAIGPRRVTGSAEKRRLLEEAAVVGHEGIVLKYLGSKYVGKRSRHWIKVKITATADLIVAKREPTSCTLMGVKNGKLTEFGRCGVPPKFSDVIDNGTFVEVKYLYVSKHGRLVQPRIIGVRDDKTEPTMHDELRVTSKDRS